MPYNPNVARDTSAEQEAGAEVEKQRQPNGRPEVTPEQKAKLAKMRAQEKAESREKVAGIQASLSLEQLQKKLGVQQLRDPEAMLFSLIQDREATPAKLKAAHAYIEAQNQSMIQGLDSIEDKAERVRVQRKIEANFNLIAKIEDALGMAEKEEVAQNPDDLSRILNGTLMRDMDLEKGAADRIFNLEGELKQLETEQDGLEKKIAELTGGKDPSQYLEDLRGRSTGLPMVGHRMRAWFAKISGTENLQSMVEQWRANNQRLSQVESQLQMIKPAKAEEMPMYTPAPGVEEVEVLGPEDMIKAPRPMAREEMVQPGIAAEQSRKARKLVEGQLKKLEARKKQIDEELALVEPQLKEYLARLSKKMTKQEAIVYNELKKTRDALRAEADDIASKTINLMNRLPPTAVETVTEIKDEDILPVEEAEEVSGVREKPRAVAPPLAESPSYQKRKAEEERIRREAEEAFEARKKQEAEAELQKNVARAEILLPGGQARTMNEDVLGQLGVNWQSATAEQRQQSVDYVFKAADYQEALISGDNRSEARLKKELEAMEKKIGLVRSPYFQPAGKAGYGVAFETGAREEQARTGGVAVRERARSRARRTVNEAPAILGITKEQAEAEEMLESAIAAEEARAKAAAEEKLMAGARATQEITARAEKQKAEKEAKNAAALERINLEADLDKRLMVPMTIERTAAVVPKAKDLWDLVSSTVSKLDKELEEQGAKTRRGINILTAANEAGVKDPATAYVMAMGRYLEAVNEPAPDHVIKAFGDRVAKMNKALGLTGNALVQSTMSERGTKFGKPAGRNIRGAARQEETRRRGQTL